MLKAFEKSGNKSKIWGNLSKIGGNGSIKSFRKSGNGSKIWGNIGNPLKTFGISLEIISLKSSENVSKIW